MKIRKMDYSEINFYWIWTVSEKSLVKFSSVKTLLFESYSHRKTQISSDLWKVLINLFHVYKEV